MFVEHRARQRCRRALVVREDQARGPARGRRTVDEILHGATTEHAGDAANVLDLSPFGGCPSRDLTDQVGRDLRVLAEDVGQGESEQAGQ